MSPCAPKLPAPAPAGGVARADAVRGRRVVYIDRVRCPYCGGCALKVYGSKPQADGSGSRETREQELASISSGLKALFKELRVAGVVACQVNRGGTIDEHTPPSMRNLRGSGMLEADGDLILLLHRPDYFAWKDNPHFTPTHELFVHVDKNKGGPVGQVQLHFSGDRQEIGDWNDGHGPHGPAFDEINPFAGGAS